MINKVLTNNRICPNPMIWNELYDLMCDELKGISIPKPLILDGWYFSSDLEKSIRFKEHLSLIDFTKTNVLSDFVLCISEDDWYTG